MSDGKSCLAKWRESVKKMISPRVVEIGTKGWDNRPPRHHRAEILAVNPSAQWIGVDLEPGDSVDVVADVHEIDKHLEAGSISAVFAASVLEHLRRPWIAAEKLAVITRNGGVIFVQTHHTFPYHPYPKDYFRFSIDAMGEIFSADIGWKVLDCGYQIPAKVIPLTNDVQASDWNFEAKAWLNIEMIAVRI